ncbi:hypothetical protein SAMN06265222_11737 [Neorhodopirellula lusitana]|uniref:Core-binding (CB) domain-containing protein n=2 Tax=Neorhodopirellula lusitana TaxID=445327 RepID=A0ABY1QKX9_9BACT|nr:hypothetical protein SAMN06265222_11737 [Neorhodopirellula lusitana]
MHEMLYSFREQTYGTASQTFFRKQTQSWYCTIGGKQISLGKTKEAAETRFHKLMGNRDAVRSEVKTLYAMFEQYLTWVEDNRKQGTYDNNLHYLKSFIASVGKRSEVGQVKKHYLTRRTTQYPDWSDTATNDAISVVQRMLNWAVQ